MPWVLMSRPASSSASGTRSPIVALISAKVASDSVSTTTNVPATPTAWTPSCPAVALIGASPMIPYQRPGLATSPASRADPKMPTDMVPQMPASPCAESAPTGSSRYFSIVITPSTTTTPATSPMIGAAQYSTYPAGAVIATRPAIAPLPAMPTSSDLVSSQTMSSAPTTPAEAPSCVFSATSANSTSSVASVDPALKPNQPIQRIITPR